MTTTLVPRKTAHLEVLGLEIPIGELNEYHDDGFVPDIRKHAMELLRRYEYYGNTSGSLPSNDDCYGLCEKYVHRSVRHVHIFYTDTGIEEANLGTRAHEETHAIGHLVGYTSELYDMFSKKIKRELGIDIDFWEMPNEEVRAYVGSICELEMRGINPEVMRQVVGTNPDFKKALEFYKSIQHDSV